MLLCWQCGKGSSIAMEVYNFPVVSFQGLLENIYAVIHLVIQLVAFNVQLSFIGQMVLTLSLKFMEAVIFITMKASIAFETSGAWALFVSLKRYTDTNPLTNAAHWFDGQLSFIGVL